MLRKVDKYDLGPTGQSHQAPCCFFDKMNQYSNHSPIQASGVTVSQLLQCFATLDESCAINLITPVAPKNQIPTIVLQKMSTQQKLS